MALRALASIRLVGAFHFYFPFTVSLLGSRVTSKAYKGKVPMSRTTEAFTKKSKGRPSRRSSRRSFRRQLPHAFPDCKTTRVEPWAHPARTARYGVSGSAHAQYIRVFNNEAQQLKTSMRVINPPCGLLWRANEPKCQANGAFSVGRTRIQPSRTLLPPRRRNRLLKTLKTSLSFRKRC